MASAVFNRPWTLQAQPVPGWLGAVGFLSGAWWLHQAPVQLRGVFVSLEASGAFPAKQTWDPAHTCKTWVSFVPGSLTVPG